MMRLLRSSCVAICFGCAVGSVGFAKPASGPVAEAKAIQREIDRAVKGKQLRVKTGSTTDCETAETVHIDRAGKVRLLERERGGQDSVTFVHVYYDASERPRVIAAEHNHVDRRRERAQIYFDQAGNTIWSQTDDDLTRFIEESRHVEPHKAAAKQDCD